MYMNNFQDQNKQQAIDTLLGARSGQEQVALYDPLYTAADEELARRKDEYATKKGVQLFLGTYNVCAQPAQRLDLWLNQAVGADIVVLSFQEIVPLTAQQMLSSAAEPMRFWETMALDALNTGDEPYIVLRSELLFATSVLLLVRESMLPNVRNVEGATKKTGFRGMSGNKGGIAVRMDVFDTDLCVVGAHLAAGNTNVDERNGDYQSIARGIQFPRGRTIESHTHVFWAGDLNYRFDQLSSAEVRSLCAELSAATYDGKPEAPSGVLAKLYAHDQLKLAQASRMAFSDYLEGPLLFRPTYKYDIQSDHYDSSEKARAPAWTDRIVYRTKMQDADSIRLNMYGCAELRISDHRPVFAMFDVQAYVVDTDKRAAVQSQLLGTIRKYSSSLPQPSDNEQQWWNQGAPLAPSADTTTRGNPFVSPPPPSVPARPGGAARAVPPPMPPRQLPSAPLTAQPEAAGVAPSAPALPEDHGESPAAPPPIPPRPDRT